MIVCGLRIAFEGLGVVRVFWILELCVAGEDLKLETRGWGAGRCWRDVLAFFGTEEVAWKRVGPLRVGVRCLMCID